MIEDRTSSRIPELSDIMDMIEQRLVNSVAAEAMSEDVASELAQVFLAGDDNDLLTLLTVARGCHAAAQVRRTQGAKEHAELLHEMGQAMLATAVTALGSVMVEDAQTTGVTRH